MNIQSAIDHLLTRKGARGAPKLFRESVESPPFVEHLRAVELRVPPIEGVGDFEVAARTLAGDVDATLRVARWRPGRPVIVYHHATNEQPFDGTFRRIFPAGAEAPDATLIAIRSPYNRSREQFSHEMRRFTSYVALIATSVRLVEHVVQWGRQAGAPAVLVAGISMGGFVANRHHAHFNTADAYTPLLAGTGGGSLLFDSAYRVRASPLAIANEAAVRGILDFDDAFAAVDHRNVFPVLARHDAIVLYARERATYGAQPVVVLSRGHATGVVSFGRLRRHILGVFDRVAVTQQLR